MSRESEHNDTVLVLILITLAAVAVTLGYAPWALASVILATIALLITTLADVRLGLAARRAAGSFVLLTIPAGLQAYVYYPAFLHAWNPRHAILPLPGAWHLGALAHYPALLATLALAGAALLTAIGLTYTHIQQRRRAPGEASWPQIGDHSGHYSGMRRTG